jgi:hypothetical protein
MTFVLLKAIHVCTLDTTVLFCAGILEQSMGARHRVAVPAAIDYVAWRAGTKTRPAWIHVNYKYICFDESDPKLNSQSF